MRNCDPGADKRLPSDRASRRWKEDLVFRCRGQLTGLYAPSWRIVPTHESDRRPQRIGGVERQIVIASAVIAVNGEYGPEKCRFIDDQGFQRPSSHLSVNSGLSDVKREASSLEIVRAPHRIASFFDLFRPFFSRNADSGFPDRDARISNGFWHRTSLRVDRTSSINVPRTHSLIRVSHEKRNVDECPPTRGKSNCHR